MIEIDHTHSGMLDSVFIPYAHLSTDALPVSLCRGAVEASIRLLNEGGNLCEFTLHRSYRFDDGRSVATVGVGSVFDVSYREMVSEVRIGRRILVLDAPLDSY